MKNLITKNTDHSLYLSLVEKNKNKSYTIERALKSISLTNSEKALLRTRLLMRKSDFSKARDYIKSYQFAGDSFLMAEKHLLTAHCFYLENKYKESNDHYDIAVELFSKIKDQRGEFISLYNKSVNYEALGNQEKSNSYLLNSEKIAVKPYQQNLVLRARACAHSLKNENDKAARLILRAYESFDKLAKYDQMCLDLISVDIFFKVNEFEKLLLSLNRLKRLKQNEERARFEFEYALIKNRIDGKKISRKSISISNSKEYSLKWDIIYQIQSGQCFKKSWKDLMGLFPDLYSLDNKFKHEDIFSYVFKSFFQERLWKKPSDKTLFKSPLAEKLYLLLQESSVPMSSSRLIEGIWGEYNPQFENRLYKLVERTKKKYGIQIVNKNNCYKLN